jgi:hypothetical protein
MANSLRDARQDQNPVDGENAPYETLSLRETLDQLKKDMKQLKRRCQVLEDVNRLQRSCTTAQPEASHNRAVEKAAGDTDGSSKR